jgi:hypothetical protein
MGRGYVAVTSAAISAASGDASLNSSALFGSFLAGDWVAVSGFATAANNGLKQISTAASSKLVLTSALTTEATGATVTIALATHFDQVRAALAAHLAAMVGLPAVVATENAEVSPTEGVAYLRTTLLPAEVPRAGAGSGGITDTLGLWQVDVFAPPNHGPGYADRMAGAIVKEFATGTRLTAGAVAVVIYRAWRESGRQEEHWYHVPVLVRWNSTTAEL